MAIRKNNYIPIVFALQLCLLVATIKSAYDYIVLPSDYLPVFHGVLAALSVIAIVGIFYSMYNKKPLHMIYAVSLFIVIVYFITEGTVALGFTVTDNSLLSNLGVVISNFTYAAFTYAMAVLVYYYLKLTMSINSKRLSAVKK